MSQQLSPEDTSRCAGNAKSRRQTRAAAGVAAARSALHLSAAQCHCLDALLCSKGGTSLLPQRLGALSMAALCAALAPLAQHADLLDRWRGAVQTACDEVQHFISLVAAAPCAIMWCGLTGTRRATRCSF